MSEKPVAIVICNYNKKDFVVNCIKSVFESNFKDFDLIVVDNASTDASVEAIKAEFGGKLTLLVNEENLGGSGGFARGMQFALDKGYKYIHLLDNDTVVEKDAVGALYEFMEGHSEAGACGSLICQMQNPEYTGFWRNDYSRKFRSKAIVWQQKTLRSARFYGVRLCRCLFSDV